jgi:hypothetical protein
MTSGIDGPWQHVVAGSIWRFWPTKPRVAGAMRTNDFGAACRFEVPGADLPQSGLGFQIGGTGEQEAAFYHRRRGEKQGF